MSNREKERIQNWSITITTEKVFRVGLLLKWHTELQRNYAYYWRNTPLTKIPK